MSLADQFITRGWTKGVSINSEGQVCLAGALCAEAGYNMANVYMGTPKPVSDDIYLAYKTGGDIVRDILRREGINTNGFSDFISWNDNEATYDDVLRVAKEADEVIDWMKEQNT